MSKLKNLSCALMVLSLFVVVSTLQAAEVQHLRCEYLENPLGIDPVAPRLSWELNATSERGFKQTAYQILVSSSEDILKSDKGDLWDSGKAVSDQQNQIEYSGKPLFSLARCFWKARIWDKDGKPSAWSKTALWTMGILKPDAWKAKWIGLDHVIPENAFDHEITEGKLVIKKAIYSTSDKAKAVDLTEKFNGMINKGTLGATITPKALGVDPGPGKQNLVVEYEYNGKPYILETPTAHTLGDIYLPSGTMYMDTPEGLNERKRWAIPRQLRKEFNAAKKVRHATVTVTALGLYEFRINGKRVGEHLLAPEWTDYKQHNMYQTYDVTTMVTSGNNVMGALLGNGWYCGGWMFWGKTLSPISGKDPSLLAQLDIEYEDGSKETIGTDETWRGTTEGPIRFAGIFEGEIYDARKEMPGWDAPGFDDSKWNPVVVRVQKEKPEKLDFQVGKLMAQRSNPIRKEMELKPIAITEPRPGVYVADMGQIFSGWTRLKINAPAGTKLTLQHNEVLNPDGTVYTDNLRAGHFGKGDRQIDRYFCRGGGEEILEPHFTYHGFRYVQINGLPKKPTVDEVAGIVFHTGFRKTGEFTCSNPLLNRLVENIQWSQRANVMGIPTDCNQRDERCGYTGDMNFFMPAAVYNFDMAPFFNKWLVDVEGAQQPEGWFADHAPYYGPGGGPNVGWSDAGILCPWRMYREYGDKKVIKEHYASMKRAMDQLISTTDPEGTRGGQDAKGRGWRIGLTDHASSGHVKPHVVIVGTAYLAANAQAMAEMARAIGENTDAAMYDELAKKTATVFSEKLIDANGRVQFGEPGPKNGDTQCGYALAFSMGLVSEQKKNLVSERFADRVTLDKGQITTGFMGNPCILQALEIAGREDIAYKLLLNEKYPSWLYPVTVGATTIWEHFGSYRPDAGGLGDPRMNSLSHYAHGAVGSYIFGNVGGIRPETPGYKRILIQPVVNRSLEWTKTSYTSIQGRIMTEWKLEDGKLQLNVTIPANVTATVYMPADEATVVTENGKPAEKSECVKLLRTEKNKRVFEVGSGSYHFKSEVSDHSVACPPDSKFISVMNKQVIAGLSPYNWVCESDFLGTTVNGASMTLGFGGTKKVRLLVDMEHMKSMSAGHYPVLSWTVNGGNLQSYQLVPGEQSVLLCSDVSDPKIDFYVKGMSPNGDRFNGVVPVNSLKIIGFAIDKGGSTVATELPPKIWLNIGDSIMSGDGAAYAEKQGRPKYDAWPMSDDGRASYGYLLAKHFGFREARIAYGGYRWTDGPAPKLSVVIDKKNSITTRLVNGMLAPAPDMVLINLGQNYAPTDPIEEEVAASLKKIRERIGKTATIVVMIPVSGALRDNLKKYFNAYKELSGDTNFHQIDLGDLKISTVDGLHPSAAGHETIFKAAVPAFEKILKTAENEVSPQTKR